MTRRDRAMSTPTTETGRLMLTWYRSAYSEPTHDVFANAILAIEAEASAHGDAQASLARLNAAEARAELRAEGLFALADAVNTIRALWNHSDPDGGLLHDTNIASWNGALGAAMAALAPEPDG